MWGLIHFEDKVLWDLCASGSAFPRDTMSPDKPFPKGQSVSSQRQGPEALLMGCVILILIIRDYEL